MGFVAALLIDRGNPQHCDANKVGHRIIINVLEQPGILRHGGPGGDEYRIAVIRRPHTRNVPTIPFAPGRFSTTTGTFSAEPRRFPKARITVSEAVPAPNGLTMVIDFFWIWAGRVDKCADHEGDCSENSFLWLPLGFTDAQHPLRDFRLRGSRIPNDARV